ncbi:MAG: hypothetical protein ACKOA8_03295 [Deltaproteobacteria bacterium]
MVLLRFFVGFLGVIFSSYSFAAIQVEQVEKWTQENSTASLESFLEWVNQTDPQQMAWFTLMKASLSAQGASTTNPRAIVFGPDSKFIFTFNGHQEQAGYQELEMIFFRENPSPRWELRKLSFSGKKQKVELSEANPSRCLSCHQNPVRPIWNAYDVWPGAYGENDDAIPDFDNDKYAIPGFNSPPIEQRRKEFAQFLEFKKGFGNHPRYSKLKFAEGSPVSPFSPNGRYSDYRFRPNLKLTESLVKLHSKTLLSRLKTHPDYSDKKKLLLATLLKCGDFVKSENVAFQKTLNNLTEVYKKSCQNPAPWNRTGYVGAGSEQHHLLFLLGIEHTDFSLERDPKYWSYFEGLYYQDEIFMMELYQDVKTTYPELPVLDYYNQYSNQARVPETGEGEAKHISEICRWLVSSEDEKFLEPLKDPVSVSHPVATCMGCHSPEGGAPYIPFESPESIRENSRLVDSILNRIESQDSKITMPPTRPLSQKEKKAIRDWLSH